MEKMEKIYNNTVSVIFNNDLYTNLDKYEYDRVYEEFYNNVYNNMDIWKNYVNEQYNEPYCMCKYFNKFERITHFNKKFFV